MVSRVPGLLSGTRAFRLVVFGGLAASTLLPSTDAWWFALAAIIVLGIPHGALDGEVARTILRPRFGRLWFPVFSLPYLTLFAVVLFSWHRAPILTLAIFLAASVAHFGAEDTAGHDRFHLLVRGGLPIAVPVLAHPVATTLVLSGIAAVKLHAIPDWLEECSLAWLAIAIVWSIVAAARGDRRQPMVCVVLAGCFVVLPPLTAFAAYFVCVHAPAHTEAVILNRVRAPRVTDQRAALLRSLPLSAMTIAIGMALWPLYDGPAPMRLLSITLQVLAALTLPHMLLDGWAGWRDRRRPGNVEATKSPARLQAAWTY